MGLFDKKAELQEIEFEVTVYDGDEQNPPVVMRMRAVSDREWQQFSTDWLEHPDRQQFVKMEFSGKKIGEHFAKSIVVYDDMQGTKLIHMSGLTVGNKARLTPRLAITDPQRQLFAQAGPDGIRLDYQDFIGLCEWAPTNFAVPMMNRYREELDKYGKEAGVVEETKRKNLLNGPAAALESAS